MLDIAGAASTGAWWPAGASLALDFAGGRSVLNGIEAPPAERLTVPSGRAPRLSWEGLGIFAGPPVDDVRLLPAGWYAAGAGTWLIELAEFTPADDYVSVLGPGQDGGNKFWLGLAFGRPYLDGATSGVYAGSLQHTLLPGAAGRIAFAYGGGALRLATAGIAISLATSVPPPAISFVSIGTEFGTVSPLGGFVRRLVYWPAAMAEAELAVLTQ